MTAACRGRRRNSSANRPRANSQKNAALATQSAVSGYSQTPSHSPALSPDVTTNAATAAANSAPTAGV
jgi:hypothetical protein